MTLGFAPIMMLVDVTRRNKLDYQNVLVKREQRVATVTLNRPERLNAGDLRTMEELLDAFRKLERDDEVRVILLNGAGRVFCAGVDLRSNTLDPDTLPVVMDTISELILTMRRLPKPIIAAVHGAAVGGGMNLALACDIILAAENTKFSQPFVLRGLHPDTGGTYFLPRLIGRVKACELFFTGRFFDAEEANRLGLINQVVPADELEAKANELALKLAKNAPKAMARIKRSVNDALEMSLASMLEHEATTQILCAMGEEVREGVRAFLEKREPVF